MIGKLADLITTNKGNNTRISYKYDEKQAKLNWMAVYASYVGTVQAEKDSKHVWNQLLKYAMNDKNDINNDVGIGLIGRTGSGKTITMHVLSDIIQNNNIKYMKGDKEACFKYHLIPARRLAGKYSEEGYKVIEMYSNLNIICIDDLGAEETISKHFGQSLNVIEEFIENRYSNNLITHFTSNLKPEKIHEVYGDRVYSRLMESVNILELSDKDYRLSENK